jgi:hypothetical protein
MKKVHYLIISVFLLSYLLTEKGLAQSSFSYTIPSDNPSQKGLAQVQITVSDPEDHNEGIISSVSFAGSDIPLQPPNPTRIRATAHTKTCSWSI